MPNVPPAKPWIVCRLLLTAYALLIAGTGPAHASFLPPEKIDKLADIVAWVAIIVAPIILIVVFWLVHILPEKIAHKKGHPQTKAIQCLCLLSLVFAGLLWPLAWLWAYSRPVFYKMAYGTDVDEAFLPKKKVKKGKKDATVPVADEAPGRADSNPDPKQV